MAKPTQIPLDFPVTPQMTRADFMVSENNQAALQAIENWQGWPHPVLLLYGPVGSGKTHLLTMWQNLTAGTPNTAAIDGFSEIVGHKEKETALFHLYNQTLESKGRLLLTSEKPAAQLGFVLPDLASRLRSCPAIGIAPPDDALMTNLLVKLFADRTLTLPPDVLAYALPRLERSFEAARGFAAAVDAASLAAKRAITIPLARAVLAHDNEDSE